MVNLCICKLEKLKGESNDGRLEEEEKSGATSTIHQQKTEVADLHTGCFT
ncbi:hypothetical protein HanXRQr2_Chr09g0382881 [Helianthus annuus]|uniref:Uncharacterized protein n=1 Tax=Helianthus annuus TaxID=4232 RepID=A0A9K3I599_HELAN|nr:hypothetical protein HanXRQr2_Chr09g0382881 [Helianthus annuus]KAJ0892690.1 hypothetical protein HanPSC8_Chr09g0368931 [Helianthus annuus]